MVLCLVFLSCGIVHKDAQLHTEAKEIRCGYSMVVVCVREGSRSYGTAKHERQRPKLNARFEATVLKNYGILICVEERWLNIHFDSRTR